MSVPKLMAMKGQLRKLTMLTAYDSVFTSIFDQAGVDLILVGDSLGMVVQGKSTTMPVTLDEMIYHGEIVVRAAKRALVIVDMPFMSYQVSPQQAVENAGRILKETGAAAVKLEGGIQQAETIRALAAADLPVMTTDSRKELRALGFTAAALHPNAGIFRGSAQVARQGDDPRAARTVAARCSATPVPPSTASRWSVNERICDSTSPRNRSHMEKPLR